MSVKSRNTQPDPRPASKEPRGDRAQKPAAPGASFYDSVFTTAANRDRAQAQNIKGLDDEIGILRLRLKALLFDEYQNRTRNANGDRKKDNTPRIIKACELIIRAYAAKNRVPGNSPEDAAEGVATLFKDVAQELGMDLVPGKTDA